MEFQVIVPVSQTQGSCTITASGNIRKPVVNRLACSDPAIQRVAQYQKELTPYSATFNLAWPTNGDLEITKTDADTGAGLQGAVFEVRKDGTLFNNTRLTSGADGKTQTVSLPAGDYTLVETQAPTGYVLDSTPIAVNIQATKKSLITAPNTKARGKLKIVKKDADNGNVKLQGAEFKLYKKANDQLITTLTTNTNGEALSGELEIGDYYIQETKAPSGYVLNSNKIDFSITSANAVVTKEVTNKKIKGKLKVIKTDETATGRLQGAEFTIYRNSDNSIVEVIATGPNGEAISSYLDIGEYYFKETKAPTGYVIDSTRYDFTVDTNDKVYSFTVSNEQVKSTIKIAKIDADTNKPLKGATFKLYRKSDDSEVTTVTTGSNGFAMLNAIPYGEYYVVETIAPEGYVLNSARQDITITDNNNTYTFSFTNKIIEGGLTISKVDGDTGSPLQGAEFKIYDSADKELSTVTTDNKGKAVVNNLSYGDYYFKETKAPTGYFISNAKVNFSIATNGQMITKTVENTKVKGRIKVVKSDTEDHNTKLQGAVFGIYDKATNTKVEEITTNKNGEVTSSDLNYGTYYVKELKAPVGYNINVNTFDVSVASDKVYTVDVTDKIIKGKLKVIKTDGKTVTKLPGAEFTIYNKLDDSEVTTIVTNTNGEAITGDLVYGDYYFVETKAPAGYVTDGTVYDFSVDTEAKLYEYNIENHKIQGKIKIIKTDSDNPNTKLQGAVFGIYDKVKNNKIEEVTTNNKGEAISSNLDYGEYYVKEITAPIGYNLNTNTFDISIESEKTYSVTVTDKLIKGKLKVIKTDGKTITKLAGAVFGVYRKDNDSEVTRITTNDDGEALTGNLTYGDYYFKELQAPEGYQLDGTRYDFNIDTEAKVYEYNIENHKIEATIKIIKTDEETDKSLKGAVFGVYSKIDDSLICELTTGDDGTVVSDPIPYGEYYVKEITPPIGYNLNTNTFDVTVNTHGECIEVPVTNRIIKGKLKITKADAEYFTRLSNATFGVYSKVDNSEVCQVTTGKDGTIETPWLNYGDYYFKELQAPEGYLLNTNTYDFSIRKDGKVYEFTAPNEPIKGKISVTKRDAELGNLAISGVVFEVKDKNRKVVATLVTDDNGYAETDLLRYGEYTIEEKTPKEGYLPNSTVYTIFISEHGVTYNIDVTNQVIKGNIQIVKIDEEHEEHPVADAEFTVYAVNVFGIGEGTEIEKVITDADGFAYTSDLRYGTYRIVETRSPEGYYVNDREYYMDITENGKTYIRFISNEPVEAKLAVHKTDEVTGKGLKGVKFEIIDNETQEAVKFTRMSGKEVETFTEFVTDENGDFITPQALGYGEYTLVETEALVNYVEAEPIEFEIAETTSMEDIEGVGTVTTMGVTNKELEGELKLNKLFKPTEIDGLNENGNYTQPIDFYLMRNMTFVADFDSDLSKPYPLHSANFNLYKLNSDKLYNDLTDKEQKDTEWTLIDTYSTDLDGVLNISGLKYGSYKLEEVDIPTNFNAVEDIYFDITTDGDIFETEVENSIKTGDVEITKFDIHDGTLLPNAHFEILDENKNIVLSGITDENGLFKFKLGAGKYYYKETQAPVFEGTEYILDEGEYPFEIKENGEIVKCKAPNKKRVTPKTSVNAPLVGVGIGIVVILISAIFIFYRRSK